MFRYLVNVLVLVTIISSSFRLVNYLAAILLLNTRFNYTLLRYKFDFYGAHNPEFQYGGRWLSAPNKIGRDAGFSGANIEFIVFNTSMVFIDLENCLRRQVQARTDVVENRHPTILTPARMTRSPAPPVDMLLTINDTVSIQRSQACGIISYTRNPTMLDPKLAYNLKITLVKNHNQSIIQFNGVWLSRGAKLIHPSPNKHFPLKSANDSAELGYGVHTTKARSLSRRKLIEVMAPASILGYESGSYSKDGATDRRAWSWTELIQEEFANTVVSPTSISNTTCLTRKCMSRQAPTTRSVKAQDIFFRASPPGTDLHNHIWRFDSTEDLSAGLVLVLGLVDVQAFLNGKTPNKHQITQFIDELARSYSSFIQTIRRTAYSASYLYDHHRASGFDSLNYIDESYLYSSSSSTIPIFLVLHPTPSNLVFLRSREIRSLLAQTMKQALNDLKWHVGDKRTFIVNTAGWLDDSDFEFSSEDHTNDSDGLDFGLTRAGHVKFARHLSTHLCHYLVDDDAGKLQCPFDRHDEYVGNLYEPETAALGKLVQERKVETIKQMFGVI